MRQQLKIAGVLAVLVVASAVVSSVGYLILGAS